MAFLSALILGILASSHCIAMCSGLQYALQPRQSILRSQKALLLHSIVLNLGRMGGYVLIGAIIAWANVSFLHLVRLGQYTNWLRIASAVIIIIIGVRMLLRKNFPIDLNFIGDTVWSVVKKMHRQSTQSSLIHSFKNGMIWAMLPCGLLYSVFLSAALSASALMGAKIMLGFALGTLPALLLSSTSLMAFQKILSKKHIQIAGGTFYCIGGIMMIFSPYLLSMDFANSYPDLIQMVFCLS